MLLGRAPPPRCASAGRRPQICPRSAVLADLFVPCASTLSHSRGPCRHRPLQGLPHPQQPRRELLGQGAPAVPSRLHSRRPARPREGWPATPPPAMCPPQPVERAPPGPAPTAPGQRRTECAEPSHPNRPAGRSCRPEPSGPSQAQPREQEPERGAWPGPWRPTRADMRLHEPSLCQDPSLRQELASLARGCDFVLPSRFKKRLKAFQQVQVCRMSPPRPTRVPPESLPGVGGAGAARTHPCRERGSRVKSLGELLRARPLLEFWRQVPRCGQDASPRRVDRFWLGWGPDPVVPVGSLAHGHGHLRDDTALWDAWPSRPHGVYWAVGICTHGPGKWMARC